MIVKMKLIRSILTERDIKSNDKAYCIVDYGDSRDPGGLRN
jgi:hypothetical protein